MAYDEKPETTDSDAEPVEGSELQSIVHGLISDAITYVDSEVSPRRAKAEDYYHARPFGNEESGRSQVVVSEVRDVVLASLPDLLKILHGATLAVEYVPRRKDTVKSAKQASEYINKIYLEDNSGFLITHGALKDGLIKRLGIVKRGVVDGDPVVTVLENVTDEQLELLGSDDTLTLTSIEETGTYTPPAPDPSVVGAIGQQAPPAAPQPTKLHRVTTTKAGEKKLAVWGVPPEEFIFSRTSRDRNTAPMIGHRTDKRRGELIAMGIDADLIDEHGGTSNEIQDNVERVHRNPDATSVSNIEAGEANDEILYVEAYARVDVDGNGVAELRKFCTIGPGFHIVNGDGKGEPVSDIPLHWWTPDPEPHTIEGQSLADLVMDLQKTQSALLRGVLDSAAASLYPRTAYQEGMVSVQDILNTEIGAPIRTKAMPGNVLQTFSHQFTGQNLVPVIQHFDELRERRTGINPGAMGIDADALQSSTKQAVGAAVTASQARTELLARIFAEMLLKPLFAGMLRDLIELKPRADVARLCGEWTEVDPKSWDATMDVTVNVALGTTAVEGKIETLMGVLDFQKEVLSTLGPSNPLVTLAQLRNTIAEIMSLKGYKDSTPYFNEVAPDWQPPQQQDQGPSPEQQLVQLESQKAQHAAQMEEAKAQMDAQRQAADLAFQAKKLEQERVLAEMKLAQERELKGAELQAQFGFDTNQAQIQTQVELAKHQAQLEVEQARSAAQLEHDRVKHEQSMSLEHEREMTAMRLEHERELEKHRSSVELEHAKIRATTEATAQEKAKPEPKQEAPKIEIHNHIPASGKKKVTRGKDGKVDGFEDAE